MVWQPCQYMLAAAELIGREVINILDQSGKCTKNLRKWIGQVLRMYPSLWWFNIPRSSHIQSEPIKFVDKLMQVIENTIGIDKCCMTVKDRLLEQWDKNILLGYSNFQVWGWEQWRLFCNSRECTMRRTMYCEEKQMHRWECRHCFLRINEGQPSESILASTSVERRN